MTFSHAIWLAIGGGVGTLVRASIAILALRLCGREFPWGTLAVNLIGSFLFGVIVSLGRGRMGFPAGCETILLVGFLGGFTTYSSFAFQSYEFFEQGKTSSCWSLCCWNGCFWFSVRLGWSHSRSAWQWIIAISFSRQSMRFLLEIGNVLRLMPHKFVLEG